MLECARAQAADHTSLAAKMGLAPQVWGSPPERKPREHFEPAAKQGPLRVMRRTAGGYSRAFRHLNPTLPPVCVCVRARVCAYRG